jgi:leader peptidase (prepilin peptidase) / N-methyltransferase
MIRPAVSSVILLLAAPFIGSFLGVLIKRLPAGRPVALARSACDHCRRALGWRDLIPVISWVLTQGRCRHCRQRIGLFYPAVELAAVGIALWALLVLPGWIAWAGAALGWTLLTLAWIDQEHFLLPDVITVPLAVAGLAIAWLIDPTTILDHVIGAAAGFVLFSVMAWLYRALRHRDGLGGGDAKLLGALGTWVGWQGLPTIVLYAAVSGLALALILAARGRHIELGHRLPFGPHLCLGGWLVWLYGPLVPL